MKMKLYLALVIVSLCCACNTEDTIDPKPNTGNEVNTEKPTDTLDIRRPEEEDIFNSEYTFKENITLGKTQQAISNRVNDFSWNVFSRAFAEKEDANLLVSPLSLTQNIMMLGNGLKGNTLEEVKTALGVSDFDMKEINSYVLQLNTGLDSVDSRTKYRTDNAIWHGNWMTVQPEFKENISGFYKTDIFPSNMDDQTLDSINQWAFEKTYGRIERMVDALNGSAAVMMNTIYFRGLWKDDLSETCVNSGEFRNENGNTEQVKMVSYHKRSPYFEGQTYQTTCRYFGNEAFAMDFILPKKGVTAQEALAEFVKTKKYAEKEIVVNLDFPVFDSASRMELQELLMSLGVMGIFGESAFNGVCLFSEPVFVSKVIQKTSISVNEKGTEAAAGTYEMLDGDNPGGEKPQTVEMKLERPFFYTIRETSTNTPLFIGYQGSVK